MMKRPLAYLAGPYSAPNRAGVSLNVLLAAKDAAKLAQMGYAVICPHTNSDMPDQFCRLPYRYWLDADLVILKRCDLLVLRDGWEDSAGSRGEKGEAEQDEQPIYTMQDVPTAEDFAATRGGAEWLKE